MDTHRDHESRTLIRTAEKDAERAWGDAESRTTVSKGDAEIEIVFYLRAIAAELRATRIRQTGRIPSV